MELDPIFLEKLRLLRISSIDDLSVSAAQRACLEDPENEARIWHAYWMLRDDPVPKQKLSAEEVIEAKKLEKAITEEDRRRAIMLRGKPEIRGTQTIHEPGVKLSSGGTHYPDRPNGWQGEQWWSGGQ